MTKSSFTLLVLGCLMCSSWARRSKSVSIEDRLEAFGADDGVQRFKQESDCQDCVTMLSGLLDGIHAAGYLESSSYENKVLTATLNKDHLYGEIASASRMPIYWSLDKDLKFDFRAPARSFYDSATQVTVTGVHTEPCEQGIGLYRDFMKSAGLDLSSSSTNATELQLEQNAAFTYLEKNFWKGKEIKEQAGKISEILKTSYDSRAIRWTVGKDFASIFYSLSTVAPTTITSYTFFKDGKTGRVFATGVPYDNGDSRYQQYHFAEKASQMGAQSLLDAASTMKIAEKAARSGINYAKMMAYGDENVQAAMHKASISAGDPNAIANLMSWCSSSSPGEDPGCKGKVPGRVSWGEEKGATMTANAEQ